jgi:hypothetical protein
VIPARNTSSRASGCGRPPVWPARTRKIAVEKQLDLARLAGGRRQLLAHEALEFLLLVRMVVAGVRVATAEVKIADDQGLRLG